MKTRGGLCVLAFLTASVALASSVTVRDADTIVVDGTPVRLNGVDALELDTSAGRDAKRRMINYLRGKDVECELDGERTYDRYVGICYVDGEDIGEAVIAAGHALDCARYSGGRIGTLKRPPRSRGSDGRSIVEVPSRLSAGGDICKVVPPP